MNYFDGILNIFGGFAADATEEIEAELRDDSLLALLLFAHHRERFARTRLTVGEDAHVVTYHISIVQMIAF